MVAPKQGDIIWIDFDPARGREQKKHRPAIVVSPTLYNKHSSIVLVCPITSTPREYAFAVPLQQKQVSGTILVDQIKACDYKDRNAEHIVACNKATLEAVLQKLRVLVG